ncbi:MAG TPA: STAS/SEC14 domain-containing protein [Candidatus Sulfotelmatobacter sp.]|nr:STAS/SEC14 domain-containing protein [Candidatus Sulfotelmatobacter sp.]
MSAEILSSNDGILAVKLAGKLTQPDLAAVQQRAAEILKQQSRMRLLVLAEQFEGWEKGGNWGDLSFQMEADPHIEKLAIVGEKKWEGLAILFTGKGLREFPIEFFPPEQAAQARTWLADKR